MSEQELFRIYLELKQKEFKNKRLRDRKRMKKEIREDLIRQQFGSHKPKKKALSSYLASPEYARLYMKRLSELPEAESPDPESEEILEEFAFIREELEQWLAEHAAENAQEPETEESDPLRHVTIARLREQARTREALAILSQLDLREIFKEARAESIRDGNRILAIFFSSGLKDIEEDIFNNVIRSRKKKTELSRESRMLAVSQFLDDCCGNDRLDTDIIIRLITGTTWLDGFVFQYVLNCNETLSGAVSMSSTAYDRVWQEYNKTRTTEEVLLTLSRIYSRERILALLQENPAFEKAVKALHRQQERSRLIKEAVLDRVPEQYTELFPLARKMERHFILHIGPTNSGKTYQSIQAMKNAATGIYLGPLRLLAFEQFESLNESGCPCNLLTGEEEQTVEGAQHQASTIEMLDLYEHYDVAVIDEAQMISDRERGGAWSRALLGVRAEEVHVCAAPHAEKLLIKLIETCQDTYEVVHHERMTPLVRSKQCFHSLASVQKHDALIVFSKRNVHAVASELQRNGVRCSVIYGSLPYDVRHEEARRFAEKETDIVVATDAIGMGLNLPIKRVVFLETSKFDGIGRRNLFASEIQQIAGRAGRLGIYDIGYYAFHGAGNEQRYKVNMKVPELKYAYLGFPEVLIGIDAPLSEIIDHWNEIEPQEGFMKASLEQEIQLARELEQVSEDKKLIYRFCMMPFEADDPALHYTWYRYFENEKNGTYEPFSRTEIPMVREISNSDELHEMEGSYALCDLAYYYYREFGYVDELWKIEEVKHEISTRIIDFLSRQDLTPRKCKYCGRVLPWDYQYGVCDSCFEQMHGYRPEGRRKKRRR